MDYLKINSPVSLDIALSLCKVSTHLGKAFIPSVRFENFNFFLAFQSFTWTDWTITRNVESIPKKLRSLTHSLLRLVEPTFPIELNRKQKNFHRNAIIVEKYYCITNTSVTTKLHVLNEHVRNKN